jgi:predicted ester cyclase
MENTMKYILIALSILMFFTTSIAQDNVAENIELLGQAFNEVFDDGNFDNVSTFFAEDFISPQTGGVGPDQITMVQTMLRGSFPDLQIPQYTVIANDEYAAVWYFLEGTFENEFSGVPPTNEPFGLNHLGVYHIVDGKITELWAQNDSMYMMQQLGIIPVEGGIEMGVPWEFTIEPSGTSSEMMTELIDRMGSEFFNQQDTEMVNEVFTEGAIIHMPHSRVPVPMTVDEFVTWMEGSFASFPDLTITPASETWTDSIITQDNFAVSRQTISMTFVNPVANFEPNNNLMNINGINLWRFEGDKIAEIWFLYDTMGEIEQMMAPPETE